MSNTVSNTANATAFIAAAAAASVAGLLGYPAIAHAACDQYAFPGDVVIVEEGTGWTVSFFATGHRFEGVDAQATNRRVGTAKPGTIDAWIRPGPNGRVTLHAYYNTTYSGEGRQVYVGDLGGDGKLRGVTDNGIRAESGIGWSTSTAMVCES